jgi:hypothetical protein
MTHNERVLALLSDGEPHSHHEGYGLRVMLHSRVADLRKQGHVIDCWREGDSYFYRLLNERESGASDSRSLSKASLSEREGPQVCSSGLIAANWPSAGSGKATALRFAEASEDPAKRAPSSCSESEDSKAGMPASDWALSSPSSGESLLSPSTSSSPEQLSLVAA